MMRVEGRNEGRRVGVTEGGVYRTTKAKMKRTRRKEVSTKMKSYSFTLRKTLTIFALGHKYSHAKQ